MEANASTSGTNAKPRASSLRWFLAVPLVILLLAGVVIFKTIVTWLGLKLWDRSPIAVLNYQLGKAEANGDRAESVRLRRLMHAECERIYGPDHRKTLLTLYYLATVVANQGDLAEAAKLCKYALEGQERVLGPSHPETLASLKLLACVLYEQLDLVELERVQQKWVQSLTAKFGPEHPDTVKEQDHLNVIRRKLGGQGRL